MPGVVFPNRSEALSPELLTRALCESQPGVIVEGLRVVEEAHCDTGSASTAARAVLDLDYAPGHDHGLPGRVILKTVLIRPGAPSSMYRNEVRFYRDLRPGLDLETPRAFASFFDEESGGFGVVMEDLRLRSAHFPAATESMDELQIVNLLEQLADLHARFWASPRFSGDLDWLWTPCSGDFYDFMQNTGREFLLFQVERCEYKQELLVRLKRSFDEVWKCLWRAQAILATQTPTLLHGDTHFGNTYLLPRHRVGLLDWQLMNRGCFSHDLSYILLTALDIEYRRAHERDLLAHYLERLGANGVESVPSLEDAWLLHRQTAIWGFFIGWMITPVENYGEEILHANLERLATGLEDLETLSALEA